MATSYSFDLVCSIDLQEADNAVNQSGKEIEHRYDLRGSNCTMELDRNARTITIRADGEHFVTAAMDILRLKLIKRGISVQALDEGKIEALGGRSTRQVISLKNGMTREDTKKITTLIKDSKIKVTTQVIDEKVRVTGKSKDDLQEAVQLVRGTDLGFPIQVENMR
ncbi:MAG: YajQ family cyclic di-GMP-binding protein [Ignavibacteriae bacterium]|nr:MAG: YajQ family cyclic di-GMP-binding protein [Ignavibacteriota bacterium]